MNLSIERAAVKHVVTIAELCSVGWRQTVVGKLSEEFQAKNVVEWYNYERVQADIEKGDYTHVAMIDSKVVGVIGGGITEPGVGQVFVLYVDEAYRYKGIGRQLLKVLTMEQKEKGVTEQRVSVQDGNQKGIPFYEARGFSLKKKQELLTNTGEEFVSLQYSRKI